MLFGYSTLYHLEAAITAVKKGALAGRDCEAGRLKPVTRRAWACDLCNLFVTPPP
jgi:hypothetical protein